MPLTPLTSATSAGLLFPRCAFLLHQGSDSEYQVTLLLHCFLYPALLLHVLSWHLPYCMPGHSLVLEDTCITPLGLQYSVRDCTRLPSPVDTFLSLLCFKTPCSFSPSYENSPYHSAVQTLRECPSHFTQTDLMLSHPSMRKFSLLPLISHT